MAARTGAGRSAEDRYEHLRREWIRQNRRVFSTIRAITCTVIPVTVVVFLVWPRAGWIAGFIAGTLLAFDISVRLNPPGWIDHWQSGAFGEQRTAEALKPLQAQGWTILHDLHLRSTANIDHIAVGPPGVFVIETKTTSGTVRRDGDSLTVTRPGATKLTYTMRPGPQVRANARDVNASLREKLGKRIWVHAVVVIWADFDGPPQTNEHVTYLHGNGLAEWLQSQAASQSAGSVVDLSDALTSSALNTVTIEP